LGAPEENGPRLGSHRRGSTVYKKWNDLVAVDRQPGSNIVSVAIKLFLTVKNAK
jgi:hypothetical protein